MNESVEYDELEDALRLGGSTWNAAQAHGLLCSRLAVNGSAATSAWRNQVCADSSEGGEQRDYLVDLLESLGDSTYRQLAERQSEFEPLLPDDAAPAPLRAESLAHWCEGFLHGLVSGPHPVVVKERLAAEPLSEIIKDLLQITRAEAEDAEGSHADEESYAELVEYIRVAAQLAYEELAPFRSPAAGDARPEGVH